MILKIFSPKNLAKILAFFAQTTASFYKKLIIKSVFEKNANFFRRKLAKIAENCGHNIDSWFYDSTEPICLVRKGNIVSKTGPQLLPDLPSNLAIHQLLYVLHKT
jgi:hypothetical protein